jgi:putative transcriptional regulator
MGIVHHLDDATLMAFAAGSMTEALAAVAGAHISVCPRCAARARHMDSIGGALLAALPTKALTRPVPTPTAAPVASDAAATSQRRVTTMLAEPSPCGVPAPLARLIGGDLDQIPWRRLGLGVWHHPLPVQGKSGGDLRLLKVGPGRRMPDHGHGGAELTLMLRGAYCDEVGTFRAGDVADLDTEVEHQPIADRETGCICLIASEHPARFKGLLSRLVQPFTGM